MKTKSFSILLYFSFLAAPSALAQAPLVGIEKVTFDNSKEASMLQQFIADTSQAFMPFLALATEDSSNFTSWKTQYTNFIDQQKARKQPKKIAKDVKNIYEDLHDSFLKKYEPLAYFDQVFKNGVYNCVTAVALYAMTFDALGIPYTIKETPTHVYIIADPEGEQLLIETTDPIKGFKSFTPGFKENFVAQLASLKLVSSDEVAEKGLYKVFDIYYFGGAKLSIKELVGIQYYNKGVSQFNDKDYINAFNTFLKAQLFHLNDQIDYMLYASLVNVISQSRYDKWEEIKLLPLMDRLLHQDITENMIIGEAQRMIHELLISRGDLVMAENAFQYFMENAQDKEVKEAISFYYHYERAIINYNRAKYDSCFHYALEAFKVNPENLNAETLLLESFKLAYRNKDVSAVIEEFDTLVSDFPELLENNNFNSMRINIYLSAMANHFENKRSTSGLSIMVKSEEIINKHPEYAYNNNILGEAYSAAAVYYFKKGYTTKAKSILRQGLKYDPDNYQLKSRLRMINY